MFDQETLIDELREKKDRLRLRIRLGSMEARSQWEELESKWKRFVEQARLREASKDVQEAGKRLADELLKGYSRLEAALAAGEDGNVRHDEVQELAYRLWEERGCPLGSPDEDWLRAEEILERERTARRGR